MSEKITVAIMCYGLYGYEYRSPEEMVSLIDYFLRCGDYIAALHRRDQLSGVVLCGGFTNPDHPGQSEAQTSAWYLQRLLKILHNINIDGMVCLEEQSHNTVQKIVFTGYLMLHRDPFTAKELIEAAKYNPEKARAMMATKQKWQKLSHNIVFICDRYQHLKVLLMLKHARAPLLPQDFQLRVKSFTRKDTQPNNSWIRQLAVAIRYLRQPTQFFNDLRVGGR